MAKAPAALLNKTSDVKVVRIPVVIGPLLALTPREKIDVVPEFVDFKIAQLTDPELIDQLGVVKRAGKDLEKWEKLAVSVLKGRMLAGQPEVLPPEGLESQGAKYVAVLTRTPRHSLSKELLEAKFGVDALEDCYTDPNVDTLNVKPIG